MKLAIGALLASISVAGFALAQTPSAPATAPAAPAAVVVPPSTCGSPPTPPAIPDGATAKRQDMEAANTAVQAYQTQVQTILACRRAEFEAAKAVSDTRFNEFNVIVKQLNETGQNWTKTATTFNERTTPAKKTTR